MRMPPLFDQDKANHTFYGAAIAAVVICVLALMARLLVFAGLVQHLAPSVIVWTAGLAVLAVAMWKEWIYDARHTDVHTVDPLDFEFTLLGGALVCCPAGALLFVASPL